MENRYTGHTGSGHGQPETDAAAQPRRGLAGGARAAEVRSKMAAKGMGPKMQPNVLITGTPGTGKTTLSAEVARRTGMEHVNVGEIVTAQGLHSGRDEEFDTFILDEDKVVDALEPGMSAGGKVLDHHSCDFYPERWFDLVVCLQTDNTVLYDRLEARGYAQNKIVSTPPAPARPRPAVACLWPQEEF